MRDKGGNILDGGKAGVRAIHILRAVRFHASWTLKNNPTMEEVREREKKMSTGVTVGFKAHDEHAGLAAIIVTASRFIFNPDSLRRDKTKSVWDALRGSEFARPTSTLATERSPIPSRRRIGRPRNAASQSGLSL